MTKEFLYLNSIFKFKNIKFLPRTISMEQLFKKINSFEPDQLEFSRYSHKKVRSVITNLMDPEVSRRCGYRTHDDLKSKKMFSKIDWDMIGTNADRFEFELISTIEMEMLPPEMNLDECTTNNAVPVFVPNAISRNAQNMSLPEKTEPRLICLFIYFLFFIFFQYIYPG